MVLSAYNKKLTNVHLRLWLKKKLTGEDLRLSQIISKLPAPSGTSHDLFEQVYVYVTEQDIRGLDSMFDGYEKTFESVEDWEEVFESLQSHVNFILT